LKVEKLALNGGKSPANYKRLETSLDTKILAFEREKNGKKIIFVGNLTGRNQNVELPFEGNLTDYMTGKTISFAKGQKTKLEPWQYYIFVN